MSSRVSRKSSGPFQIFTTDSTIDGSESPCARLEHSLLFLVWRGEETRHSTRKPVLVMFRGDTNKVVLSPARERYCKVGTGRVSQREIVY